MPLTFLSADLSAWLFLRCGIAPSPVPFGARWLREAVDVLALDDRFAREERAGYADFVCIVVACDRRDSPVLVDALHDRDMHAFRWAAAEENEVAGRRSSGRRKNSAAVFLRPGVERPGVAVGGGRAGKRNARALPDPASEEAAPLLARPENRAVTPRRGVALPELCVGAPDDP